MLALVAIELVKECTACDTEVERDDAVEDMLDANATSREATDVDKALAYWAEEAEVWAKALLIWAVARETAGEKR